MRRLAFLALTLATGCSDALEQTSSAGQVIGVVNANDRTLSVISATDFSVSTHDWQSGTASPRTIDGRGHVFVVPLGAADAVGISRFFTCPAGALACVRPDYVLPLAPGSGATGVAIQDDSIAWIANPNLNTVTRVNYLRNGDTTSVTVGVYPQAVAIVGTRVFVVNSNLVGATPAGPSWLTSFDCCTTSPTPDSIALTGANARFAVVGDDSLLYVIASGHAGAGDGKLSIVDPQTRVEVAVLNGLGESPGAAAFHPAGSRLLVASATEGILEVNASIRAITRGPGDGVKPGGNGVSGLAIDLRGRVYAVDAGTLATPEFCAVSGGVVHVLSAPPDYHEIHTATVGCGPTTAAVAATP
jgi:DNA-binding beta-propeller fold protein YncE